MYCPIHGSATLRAEPENILFATIGDMLDAYHQKYADQPDEELQRRLDEKLDELMRIRAEIQPRFLSSSLEVAVLGCGDRRFIAGHEAIFTETFGKPAEITTFDITIDHLLPANNVYEHDCTLPLPRGPFDITFAHVLLRFIPRDSQWDLVRSSFEALKPGGIAIHVLDPEDYQETTIVDLPSILSNLESNAVDYKIIDLSIGRALVIKSK